MMFARGITRLTNSGIEALVRDAPPGTRVFMLGSGVRDKRTLFAAIRDALPLDPPFEGSRDNWDALEDSLWSGLHALREARIIVFWPDAAEMERHAKEDFDIAIAILGDIAATLADPKVANGPVKDVIFVLGGAWPS